MSSESPPPYSAVLASPLAESLPAPEAAIPFNHSDHIAATILALVSEGKTLDARFKDVRDVASACAKFECQEPAVILCQKFEEVVWESRKIAGVALVALKDFNEVVLDFLSESDVAAQDRLKELVNVSKLLQRERDSATNQKASFDVLIKEVEDFHRMINSESGARMHKKRRQNNSRAKGIRDRSGNSRPYLLVPRSQPVNALSMVTASIGAFSRTCMDYALQFERAAENAGLPLCVNTSPEAQETSAVAAATPERKRLCPSTDHAESVADLPGIVNELMHDLRSFASRIDVFNTVFAELAREQDVFVLYLKDGQSVTSQGYRFEIDRLRRHLPRICNALDAYSKGRLV